MPMDSAMIRKMQKAKQYAQEPQRFRFVRLEVLIQGNNATHRVTYDQGIWQCDCDFFQKRGQCSHTMAVEYLLDEMLG